MLLMFFSYLEKTFHPKYERECVVQFGEEFVPRAFLDDGVLGSQSSGAQQYHKHDEAVKKRLRHEPMKTHAETKMKKIS